MGGLEVAVLLEGVVVLDEMSMRLWVEAKI